MLRPTEVTPMGWQYRWAWLPSGQLVAGICICGAVQALRCRMCPPCHSAGSRSDLGVGDARSTVVTVCNQLCRVLMLAVG